MSVYVWVNPQNPAQKFYTSRTNDPTAPAGYVLTNTSDGSWQGVDGVNDMDIQTFMAGVNSGGYPVYTGDPTANPKNPNGILGG